jgi:hypothetical protein
MLLHKLKIGESVIANYIMPKWFSKKFKDEPENVQEHDDLQAMLKFVEKELSDFESQSRHNISRTGQSGVQTEINEAKGLKRRIEKQIEEYF